MIFLLSTWAVVSFLALLVVGLAWTLKLKPQALADARAQRQEIVRVLARLAEASRALPIRLAFEAADAVRLASLLDTALTGRTA